MTEKLRLGPLPKTDVAKLTIALPTTVKADLDRYAALYAETYGEQADVAMIAAHMIASFMERDRGFRKTRSVARAEERAKVGSRTVEGDQEPSRA